MVELNCSLKGSAVEKRRVVVSRVRVCVHVCVRERETLARSPGRERLFRVVHVQASACLLDEDERYI